MATETRPRQLDRSNFVVRLRELIDEGLDHDTIIEKMTPCCSMSVSAGFLADALADISSALLLAPEVGNKAMSEAHTRFVGTTRLADEFDTALPKQQGHLRQRYANDPTILDAELVRLESKRVRLRASADQAAAAWQLVQEKRIPFDQARLDFPTAFSEFSDWQPTPRK